MLGAAAGAAVGTVSFLVTCCCPPLSTAMATSPACSSVAAVSSVVCGSWSMSPAAAMLVKLADAAEEEEARLEEVWKLKGLGKPDQNQWRPVVGCFVHAPPKPQPREDAEACLGISPGGRSSVVGAGPMPLLLLLDDGDVELAALVEGACALPPAARAGIQTCNRRGPVPGRGLAALKALQLMVKAMISVARACIVLTKEQRKRSKTRRPSQTVTVHTD